MLPDKSSREEVSHKISSFVGIGVEVGVNSALCQQNLICVTSGTKYFRLKSKNPG